MLPVAALSTPKKSKAILFRARQTIKIRRVAANRSMIIIQLEKLSSPRSDFEDERKYRPADKFAVIYS
jgi:hypothetical protein